MSTTANGRGVGIAGVEVLVAGQPLDPRMAPLLQEVRIDDNLTLPLLAVGARGTISVASHWAGEHLRAMFEAFDAGDVAEACRINHSSRSAVLKKSTCSPCRKLLTADQASPRLLKMLLIHVRAGCGVSAL